MAFEPEFIRKVTNITSNDNKMLLLNGRYYCELTENQHTRTVGKNYCFFSEAWKEDNCPTLTQYTDCFVLDTHVGQGHHMYQFGKIYHSVHKDLDNMHTFMLMLSIDNAMITISSVEIVDKPYPAQKLMDLIDKDIFPKDYAIEDSDPMLTLDGTAFIDFAHLGKKSVGIEYSITGKLYVEIVDFTNTNNEIVNIGDTSKREVLVNMFIDGRVLSDDNVEQIANIINTRVKTLKEEYENGKRS